MSANVTLWTADEIAAATGGTVQGAFEADGVTFDSREVIGGELFIAMKGEQADGHDYVGSAFERGAAGVIAERQVGGPHVLVADGFEALQALGRASRARTEATVIGVTGSVGKTSTKELMRMAFEENAPGLTHASVKSYNNHTGVPLSLARMHGDSRYGIFEMGMNHAGELAGLTRIARPHIACVTWIAPAHIEFFDSIEGIADAKGEIFEGLEPGGTAVIPRDSDHYERLRAKAEQHADTILSFGNHEAADIRCLRSAEIDGGTAVVAAARDEEVAFVLKQTGQHWVSNALCALAAAHAAGADITAAALGMAQLGGLAGRGERSTVPWKGGDIMLIDESYNANPTSMAASLAVLGAAQPEGRKVAVLGQMGELGGHSEAAHADLAQPVADAGVERLYLVGQAMQPLAERTDAVLLPDWKAALEALNQDLRAGDLVLLKGSNSVGLGNVVKALKEQED